MPGPVSVTLTDTTPFPTDAETSIRFTFASRNARSLFCVRFNSTCKSLWRSAQTAGSSFGISQCTEMSASWQQGSSTIRRSSSASDRSIIPARSEELMAVGPDSRQFLRNIPVHGNVGFVATRFQYDPKIVQRLGQIDHTGLGLARTLRQLAGGNPVEGFHQGAERLEILIAIQHSAAHRSEERRVGKE